VKCLSFLVELMRVQATEDPQKWNFVKLWTPDLWCFLESMLSITEMEEQGFTSHLTQNRSFWRHSSIMLVIVLFVVSPTQVYMWIYTCVGETTKRATSKPRVSSKNEARSVTCVLCQEGNVDLMEKLTISRWEMTDKPVCVLFCVLVWLAFTDEHCMLRFL